MRGISKKIYAAMGVVFMFSALLGNSPTVADLGSWTPQGPQLKWRSVASSSDSTHLAAVDYAVGNSRIFTSIDAGVTWKFQTVISTAWKIASSADGTHLVVITRQGPIYTSSDSGQTWLQHAGTKHDWFDVASSADGSRLVAVTFGDHYGEGGAITSAGRIYISTDFGQTWTARGPGGEWSSVASSGDGNHLVAADEGGYIYTSSDSGLTWNQRFEIQRWGPIASSLDGSHLIVIGSPGQFAAIYTSNDFGLTWQGRDLARDYRGVATSMDGSHLLASVYGGYIYSSSDFGETWRPVATKHNWYDVALSSDGSHQWATVADGPGYTFTATVPGIPGIGLASATGAMTAEVSYIAPATDGGDPITSYSVLSIPSGAVGKIRQSGSGTILVSGLSPNTRYSFTVVATNSFGDSFASGSSNSISTLVATPTLSPKPASPPSPPKLGTPVLTGPNSAEVSFSAPPSDGGSTITSYNLTSSPPGWTATLNQAGPGKFSVIGLKGGVTYTFTVTATNGAGTSPPSAPSNPLTISNSLPSAPPVPTPGISAITAPGAPVIGVAVAVGPDAATVSFSAPASNGGAPIIAYTATSSPPGGKGSLVQGGSGSIVVIGLAPATNYTFTVTADNRIGTSPPSPSSNSITTFATKRVVVGPTTSTSTSSLTAPMAPTIGSASATGPDTAEVSFSAPISDGGSEITAYTVTSFPGGGTGVVHQKGSGVIHITGLEPATTYTFTVTATNTYGDSPASAHSKSISTTPVGTTGSSPTDSLSKKANKLSITGVNDLRRITVALGLDFAHKVVILQYKRPSTGKYVTFAQITLDNVGAYVIQQKLSAKSTVRLIMGGRVIASVTL